MKKNYTLLFFLLIATTATAQVKKLSYSNWLFVQSDKALQYRIAIVKQVGDVATLQLQFRVNNDDAIFCKSTLCDGMLLSLKNTEVGDDISTKYSFIFKKSFVGVDNIYTWPQQLTTELKTWPDGSKRYLSLTKGIVYTNPGSDVEYHASVPDCCVDVILAANPKEHRCDRHGFDSNNAIIVQ
jgi:hypothetical protein